MYTLLRSRKYCKYFEWVEKYILIFLFICSMGLSKLGVTNRTSVMYTYNLEYWNNAYKASTNTLQSKEELTELCTKIIFASTAKHAAINFLQWDYACFAPVCPYSMRGKLPTEDDRGNITTQHIMKSLPERKVCIRSAGIAFTLTEFSDDEVFLLLPNSTKKTRKTSVDYIKIVGKSVLQIEPRRVRTQSTSSDNIAKGSPNRKICANKESAAIKSLSSRLFPPRWLFMEDEVKTAFISFQNRLHRIEDKIKARNVKLNIPYEVLLPSRIPSGIAI